MQAPPARDVTQFLLAWRQGDHDALDRLLLIAYSELRKMAHTRVRADYVGLSGPASTETRVSPLRKSVDGPAFVCLAIAGEARRGHAVSRRRTR